MKGFIKLGICNEPFNLTGVNKLNIKKLLEIWDEKFVISSNFITNSEPYRLARLLYNGKRWCVTDISKEDFEIITKSINRDTRYFHGKIDNKESLIRYDKILNPIKTEREKFIEYMDYYIKNNIPCKISKKLIEEYSLEEEYLKNVNIIIENY